MIASGTRIAFACLLVIWGVLSGAAAAPAPSCAAGTAVTTASGTLCGSVARVPTADGAPVRVYRGIPYALPPVPGQGGRWKAPQDPAPFAEPPYRATRFGAACAQPLYETTPAAATRALHTVDGAALLGSEDCLTLNVHAPAAATPASGLPVMVFLYGGAFVSGAASQPMYDAAYLAAAGEVVVVAANYRLGAYGFLFAEAEAGAPAIAGNFGLLDQQKALEWVQRNIAGFGGDPGRVTLFGESAGAMSVGLHLFAMPSSRNLFRQAIMESNPLGIPYRDAGEAAAVGRSFLSELCSAYRKRVGAARCPARAELVEKATTGDIFAAQMAYASAEGDLVGRLAKGGSDRAMNFAPTLDGDLVVAQPNAGFAAGIEPRPFLFGVNRDEGVLFAALSNGERPVTGEAYGAALAGMFGREGRARIEAFTGEGGRIYSSAGAPAETYYGRPAAALATLLGDHWFRCANLDTARLAAARLAKEGRGQVLYAYEFVQPPAYDAGLPACAPGTGNVCHGDELPYVFNTLASVARAVPPQNQALATAMADAWTAYARSGRPGDGWPAFDGTLGSPAKVLAAPGRDAPTLDALGNCSAFWLRAGDPVARRR